MILGFIESQSHSLKSIIDSWTDVAWIQLDLLEVIIPAQLTHTTIEKSLKPGEIYHAPVTLSFGLL